jgi:hypothetical protein
MDAMPEWFQITVVLVICTLVFIPLLVGLFLVIRDTRRGYGRWGVNPRPLRCPRCDFEAPLVRTPANLRQMLWGGVTCEECGCEYDKWGKPLVLPDYDPPPSRSRTVRSQEPPAPPARPSDIKPGPSPDIKGREQPRFKPRKGNP